jgi:serine/threonine protein kinase
MSDVPTLPEVPVVLDEPTVQRDPLIGLVLGEYQVLRRIGVGGMGIVYEGIQPLIGKRVAIKVLRPEIADSVEAVRRFIDEARSVNTVRRHVTVDVFSFGQLPDRRHYFVMEFLEGEPLEALMSRRKRLPVQEVLLLLDGVLDALASIHLAGLIHRDMKPSNVFLAFNGDQPPAIKVLDFGLAKRSSGEKWAQPSTAVAGTPDFMSPEQIRGDPLTVATDLYAVGCMAFEMLAGMPLFAEANGTGLLTAHLETPPPRPSSRAREIPPSVDAFVLWLLAKEPSQRPASAEAARTALNKLRQDLRRPRAKAAPTRPAEIPRARDTLLTPMVQDTERPASRRGRLVAIAVAFLFAAGGAFAGLWWQSNAQDASSVGRTLIPPAHVASQTTAPSSSTPELTREPDRKRPRTLKATAAVTPSMSPGSGRLVLRVPAGKPELGVSVDGKELGLTPQSVDLPPGRHVVTLFNAKARILIPDYPVDIVAGKLSDPVPWLLEPRAHP